MTTDMTLVPEDDNDKPDEVEDDGLTSEPDIDDEAHDDDGAEDGDSEELGITLIGDPDAVREALAIAVKAVKGALQEAGLDVDVISDADEDEDADVPVDDDDGA